MTKLLMPSLLWYSGFARSSTVLGANAWQPEIIHTRRHPKAQISWAKKSTCSAYVMPLRMDSTAARTSGLESGVVDCAVRVPSPVTQSSKVSHCNLAMLVLISWSSAFYCLAALSDQHSGYCYTNAYIGYLTKHCKQTCALQPVPLWVK